MFSSERNKMCQKQLCPDKIWATKSMRITAIICVNFVFTFLVRKLCENWYLAGRKPANLFAVYSFFLFLLNTAWKVFVSGVQLSSMLNIDQREIGSFNINLSHTNKSSV